MSMILVFLIGFLNLLGEATWLRSLTIINIAPNLSLILVVVWGILQGNTRGRILGMWIGLLQDILFCRFIGFYALIYYLLGHFSGYFNKDFYQENFLLPLAVVVVSDLIYGLLQYLIYHFFLGDLQIGYYFLHRILPEVCYTALVCLPLYPLLRLLSHGMKRIDGLFVRRQKE